MQQRGARADDLGAMLSYQRLDVYQCAVRLLSHCTRLSQDVPKGFSSLTDQLRRASLSIPLNIAEGAGRATVADAARFYSIARGSAMECGAILDALEAMGCRNTRSLEAALALVVRIVEMLTRLCRNPSPATPPPS
jgi:four helix bundle protein